MRRQKIKTGDKFHFLKVIEEPFYEKKISKKGKKYQTLKVKCVCDCGNEKIVNVNSLLINEIKSCGCYHLKHRLEYLNKYRELNCKHIRKSPLYNSWNGIKSICKNSLNKEIKLYEKWKNFKEFEKFFFSIGWVKGLFISRKDTTKSFYPDNCCLKTKSQIISENYNPEKTKETSLIRYGVEHPLKDKQIRERIKETCYKKYGGPSPMSSEEVKDKLNKVFIKKYGSIRASCNNDIKEKSRKTMLSKYGYESPSLCPEIRKKQVKTLLDRYGTLVVNTTGSKEKEIREWLNQYNYIFNSNFEILNGKEIDLFNNELKLGIEYCGLHWHHENSKQPRNRSYHYNKYRIAKEKGIRLITIFSDEWLNKTKQVKNFLLSIIKKANNTIYARDCDCKEIPSLAAREFIDENHIQGAKKKALVYFGLVYDKEVVGVLSLNRHHRNNQQTILDRLCFSSDYHITGGASRMLSLSLQWCKSHNINKIITWSDNRWSEGNLYSKLGFKLDKELGPDYSYVLIKNPKERISKQKMRKKEIGCPSNITEKQFLLDKGYSRIWDCGKKRWVYNI